MLCSGVLVSRRLPVPSADIPGGSGGPREGLAADSFSGVYSPRIGGEWSADGRHVIGPGKPMFESSAGGVGFSIGFSASPSRSAPSLSEGRREGVQYEDVRTLVRPLSL